MKKTGHEHEEIKSSQEKTGIIGGLVVILLFSMFVLLILFQPFENPVDVMKDFSISFSAGDDHWRHHLSFAAGELLNGKKISNMSELAAEFEKRGVKPRKEGFWFRKYTAGFTSGNYDVYLARGLGGWRICYISEADMLS